MGEFGNVTFDTALQRNKIRALSNKFRERIPQSYSRDDKRVVKIGGIRYEGIKRTKGTSECSFL